MKLTFSAGFCALLISGASLIGGYAAAAGSVRREVEAAGFVFDSESSILTNSGDPCTIKVFDKSIQGHTDQFILKFRKPK